MLVVILLCTADYGDLLGQLVIHPQFIFSFPLNIEAVQ